MAEALDRGIGVRRLAGRIGAVLDGVDLAVPLTGSTITSIRAALLRHKVVFFRGQRLGHAEHIAFGRCLGELTRRPGRKHGVHPDGYPEILTVDPHVEDTRHGRRFEERFRPKALAPYSGWHVDLAAAANPPAISVLRAEVVPRTAATPSGPTWSPPTRAWPSRCGRSPTGCAPNTPCMPPPDCCCPTRRMSRSCAGFTEDTLLAVHPVVRVHPETGERALFTPPASVTHLLGLLPWESHHLLELFHGHIGRPEYTVRWQWAPGDVAVWDNRAVAHLQPH